MIYRHLIKKQEEVFEALTNNKNVLITGESGTGKTYVLQSLKGQFDSGLTEVIYIYGVKQPQQPFEEFTQMKVMSEKKWLLDFETSIKNANIEAKVKTTQNTTLGIRNKLYNYFHSALKKKHCILIIDDFQFWKQESISLLKILVNEYRFYKKGMTFCIITQERFISDFTTDVIINFQSPRNEQINDMFEDNNINGLDSKKIDFVGRITNHNLSRISLIIQSCCSNPELLNNIFSQKDSEEFFLSLLKKSFESINECEMQRKKVLDILCYSALIGMEANYEDLFYFIGTSKTHIMQLLDNDVIKKWVSVENNKIRYLDDFINELFYKLLKKTPGVNYRYEHIRYAEYLEKKNVNSYIATGYHYKMAGEIEKAVENFIIAYFIYAYQDIVFPKSIEMEISSYLSDNEIFANYFKYMKLAYNNYLRFEYEKAIECIRLVPDLKHEVLNFERSYLLALAKLNSSTRNVRLCIQLLESIREKSKNRYCGIWVRTMISLIGIYTENADNYNEARKIYDEILYLIELNNNSDKKELNYIFNVLKRKSCLIRPAYDAAKQSEEAILYFEKEHITSQYILALCNHSGNLLASGEFNKAIDIANMALNKLEKLEGYSHVENCCKNNLLIAKFLTDSSQENYKECLEFLKNKGNASTIYVINLANLYMLKGGEMIEEAIDMLEKVRQKLREEGELDSFYKYYITSNLVVAYYVNGNLQSAKKELEKIKNLSPTYNCEEESLINTRYIFMKKIIFESRASFNLGGLIGENPCDENSALLNTWNYIGRCLLFSDLQILTD